MRSQRGGGREEEEEEEKKEKKRRRSRRRETKERRGHPHPPTRCLSTCNLHASTAHHMWERERDVLQQTKTMQGKARSGQNKRKRSIQPYLSLTICHLLTTPALHGGAPLASTSTFPLLSMMTLFFFFLLLPLLYPLLPPLSPPDNKNIIPHRPHPSTTTTTTTTTTSTVVVSHHHHQQTPRKSHRKESKKTMSYLSFMIYFFLVWFHSERGL